MTNFLKKGRRNLISIIIPVYKDEVGLSNTLRSLETQTVKGFEYEVVVMRDLKGDGSYRMRNEGITKSTGEYLAFIDAGTIADKEWLLNGFLALQYYDYVGGSINIIRNTDNLFSSWLEVYAENREFAVSEFMEDMHFAPTTNLFIKRSLISEVGFFDKRLKSSGDLEFGSRVYENGNFSQVYDEKVKVYHPLRGFVEYIEKQDRLARGFADLNKYYPDRFGRLGLNLFKIIIPPIWLLKKKRWIDLNLLSKAKVFLLTYLFGFIQHVMFSKYYLLRILKFY